MKPVDTAMYLAAGISKTVNLKYEIKRRIRHYADPEAT